MDNRNRKILKSISILIPAKDEEETIGAVLSDVNRETQKMPEFLWEVIVIADHCIDNTATIAKKNGAKVITNINQAGKGNALISGFEIATGDIIVMMDADGSHIADDIKKFIPLLIDEHVGLVIGSRCLGGSGEYTVIRSLGNVIFTAFINILFNLKLTDGLNGFKAFKKDIVKNHKYSCKSFEIEVELIYNTLLENQEIFEVASYERSRAGGEMKSRAIIHGSRFLWCIISKGIKYNLHKFFHNSRGVLHAFF